MRECLGRYRGAEPKAGNIHNQNKNNNDDNKDDDKDDDNRRLEGIYVVYAYRVSRYRQDGWIIG